MAVLDVKKKPENELFEVIISSRPEARVERIEALNELVSRQQFLDRTAVFHGILAVAKFYGISTPEGSMLSELLSKLMRDDEVLFGILLSNLADQVKNRYFIGFAARFIRNVKPALKAQAIPSLVSVLIQQDSIDTPADSITDTLTMLHDEKLDDQVTSELLPKILSANPMQVLLASRVLSKISGENALKEMLVVLDRTLAEWYGQLNNPGQLNDQIQDQVILYLIRSPSEKVLPLIRKTVLVRRTGFLTQMFQGFRYRPAAQMLEEIIEQYVGILKDTT